MLDCKVERNSKGQYLVRGRVFDHSKPQTFNQPWTPEEQRRLEELLIGMYTVVQYLRCGCA